MTKTLIKLAEIHYGLGVIGHDELLERINVALWLADNLEGRDGQRDPRSDSEEEIHSEANEDVPQENKPVIANIDGDMKSSGEDEESWIEFICLGIWVFTKSDPDSYPSVPHGHYRNQNIPWPKLNPYTGRVFSSKHQEDKSQRLTKKEMKKIWSDEKFKSFSREMIVWYQEQFPYFDFPVRRPLRMPRW